MIESTYTVQGMTCGHCVSSVKDEVGRIDGVHEVDVDLSSGRLAVTSEVAVDAELVAGAVAEAGYDLVR